MNKHLTFLFCLVFGISLSTRADEGMWLLHLLQEQNMEKMKEMSLELTAEEIYSINNSSLKDAVGALDGGSCTAELISAEGLLLTNHHCGYDEIQNHSSIENNYLKNGFWAMTKEEELPNPGKTVTFVIRIEDVTEKILPELPADLTGDARSDELELLTNDIIDDATEGTHYDAYIRPFFNGNQYILFVNETFRDVRLVGAPPESIGKFGHDTDNWMWPRHTGDFSLFRVYTGPDGKPADYSEGNIPLNPKHFLPISLNGYEKDDFTMVIGFPGSTDRYMTSWEIEELLNITHPNRIKIRGVKQELMMEDMRKSEEIDIMYSAKYSQSSNYWKYSIGQSEGLRKLKVVERKQNLEDQFRNWVSEDADRQEKYGEALELIKEGIEGRRDYKHTSEYLLEAMFSGMETVQMGNMLRFLYHELGTDEPNMERVAMISSFIRSNATEFYEEYNIETDKKITVAMLNLVLRDVKVEFQPDILEEIRKKYKGNVEKYVDRYFKKSILPYENEVMAFLDDPDFKTLEKDPGVQLAVSFFNAYMGAEGAMEKYNAKIEAGARLWMAGLMEMQKDKIFYPDANSTIRLTYGSVGDYYPKDAVLFSYYTTLEGVMEKEDPTNPEFLVSEKLKELYRNKDYGQYGDDGVMHVCFTTDNDITGGNSGSPVINSRGELLGIAFDGNWEAMSGDVAFESDLQKCINVDIRYVLFVID
ncbi:MAG: S46 family peptidase, partial [Bacteroidales bacterium]